MQGTKFFQALNNGNINETRAKSIYEKAKMIYKRKIEDLELEKSNLKITQDNILDFHGDSGVVMSAASFDGNGFAHNDIEIGIKLVNNEICLKVAKERYEYLFGEKYDSK